MCTYKSRLWVNGDEGTFFPLRYYVLKSYGLASVWKNVLCLVSEKHYSPSPIKKFKTVIKYFLNSYQGSYAKNKNHYSCTIR